MNKRNTHFTVTSFFFLFIILALACNFPGFNLLRPESTGLQLDPRAPDGTVTGRYQYSGEAGKKTLLFSVSTDGLTSFRLDNAPDTDALIINTKYDQLPHLIWQGKELDGVGALTSEQQAALDDVRNSDLAHGLAMIPLDMACQGEDAITPAQVAALLFPLQMRFKYQTADRSALAAELAALTQCDYSREDGEPGQHPPIILMTPADPVPVVLGYFPFDEIGAVETASTGAGMMKTTFDASFWNTFSNNSSDLQLPVIIPFEPDPIQDEWGPCEAKCRGACGPDCTHNNCKFVIDDRCEKNMDGENDGSSSLVQVYECGTHPACIEHDTCYDDCNRRHGCGTFAAAVCRHAGVLDPSMAIAGLFDLNISCDRKVLNDYPYGDVEDWALGYGPQPNIQVFEYHIKEHRYVDDPIKCPRPDQVQDETSPETAPPVVIEIQGDTYKGSVNYFNLVVDPRIESITSEIEITVAEDGRLAGTLSVHFIEVPYVNEQDDCSGQWEAWHEAVISGQLTDNRGAVNATVTRTSKNFTNCPGSNPGYSITFDQIIDIEIIGDSITGSTRLDSVSENNKLMFTLTATRQ